MMHWERSIQTNSRDTKFNDHNHDHATPPVGKTGWQNWLAKLVGKIGSQNRFAKSETQLQTL